MASTETERRDEAPGADALGNPTRSRRASALPADERRSAIVDSTLPLLLAHGTSVTTRQIAEAAGIAEGTIFRVFPDKDSLFDAVILRAFDREPVEAAMWAIDRSLPLEDRLVEAVGIIQTRISSIWQLMTAVDFHKEADPTRPRPGRGDPDLTALTALFEPDRATLRREPVVAARLLYGLAFAGAHPLIIADEPMSATEIVSVILDGIRIPDAPEAHPHASHAQDTHSQEPPC